MKRSLTAILAALLIGMLTGCSGTGIDFFKSNAATSAGGSPYDYTASGKYMEGDTLIMTVQGSPVYWDEYYYWMSVAVMNIVKEGGEIADWDGIYAYSDDMYGRELDYNEFVRYYAYDAALMYRTIEKRFETEGLSLDEGDVYSAQDFMEDNGLESQEEFEAALESAYITQELFEYIETVSAEYYALLESVYGVQGAGCPDDEVWAFAESQGYMQVKYIRISVENEAEAEEEAKTEAEDVLAQLQGLQGGELEAAFDEKMLIYSDDLNVTEYPNGYLFKAGDFSEDIETVSEALGEYELSELVEAEKGYYIILRIPIDPDTVPYGESDSLRYLTAYDRFDSIVSGWQKELAVTYEDAFSQIIPSEIFVS